MDTVFYYFIWGNHRWHILLISIIFLRKIYPLNKIKVVCYTKPPIFFYKKSFMLNFEICPINSNFLLDKFNDKSNLIFSIHKNLIYKILNCFELSQQDQSKSLVLDCDLFVFDLFDEIDWNKISIFHTDSYVNTGVIGFDSSSINFKLLKHYFFESVHNLLDNNFNQIDYIEKAMGKKWIEWRLQSLNFKKEKIKKNQLLIQEEIIFNYIFKNVNKNIFKNIQNKNNGMLIKEEINNFHLMNYNPKQIYQIFSNITYCRKMIKKNIPIKKTKQKLNITSKINNIIFKKKYLFL